MPLSLYSAVLFFCDTKVTSFGHQVTNSFDYKLFVRQTSSPCLFQHCLARLATAQVGLFENAIASFPGPQIRKESLAHTVLLVTVVNNCMATY